jgi:hypothetical protein
MPFDPYLKCPVCGRFGQNVIEKVAVTNGSKEGQVDTCVVCKCGHIVKMMFGAAHRLPSVMVKGVRWEIDLTHQLLINTETKKTRKLDEADCEYFLSLISATNDSNQRLL